MVYARGPRTVLEEPIATRGAATVAAFVARLARVEPGLVGIAKDILEAQTRPSTFTHTKGGRFTSTTRPSALHPRGTGAGHVELSAGGRCVTKRHYAPDWAIMTPGTQNLHVRCWRATVHAGGPVALGVIGTTEPAGTMYSLHHPTSNGWGSFGTVYVAGAERRFCGGWPREEGLRVGDEAALCVDRAARTLTLKHRRLGRAHAYTIAGLDTDVQEWFVHACLFCDGDSLEVQPLSHADFLAIAADGSKWRRPWPCPYVTSVAAVVVATLFTAAMFVAAVFLHRFTG